MTFCIAEPEIDYNIVGPATQKPETSRIEAYRRGSDLEYRRSNDPIVGPATNYRRSSDPAIVGPATLYRRSSDQNSPVRQSSSQLQELKPYLNLKNINS